MLSSFWIREFYMNSPVLLVEDNSRDVPESSWYPREAEVILVDRSPTRPVWVLVPMFKATAHGNIIMWQIGFDGVDKLLTAKRIGDGNLTCTNREIHPMGNRSMQEQALQEARHRYTLKFRQGYLPAGSNVPPLPKAMCGENYKPEFIRSWPVSVEPKLDGVRILMYLEGQTIRAFTRQNKEYRHLGHITGPLMDLFVYLPTNTVLDGELYIHGLEFTELVSIVRTGIRKDGSVGQVSPRLHEVKYYIFDICVEDLLTYEDRKDLLIRAYDLWEKNQKERESTNGVESKTFYLVGNYVAKDDTAVKWYHDEMVDLGFEGLMIKKRANGATSGPIFNESLYKRARCRNILKLKDFDDKEMIVRGVKEGEGTEKGTALLVVEVPGNQQLVAVRCRGSFEMRRQWLLEPHKVIGKPLTVRFQKFSKYGIPRFPVGIAIRNYE